MKLNYFNDPKLQSFIRITLRIHKKYFWIYGDTNLLRNMGILDDLKQSIYQYYYQYKPTGIKACSSIGGKCLYRFYTDYKLFKRLKHKIVIDPEGNSIDMLTI